MSGQCCTARLMLEDQSRAYSCGFQRLSLYGQILIVRTYPRVAKNFSHLSLHKRTIEYAYGYKRTFRENQL